MKNFLSFIQIFCSLFLIILVLLQTRGGGLSPILGASLQYHTKRGVEKLLFYLTIFFAFVFALVSILAIVFQPK